jgi:hypothetical protein
MHRGQFPLRAVTDQLHRWPDNPSADWLRELPAPPPRGVLASHMQSDFERTREGFADLISATKQSLVMFRARREEAQLWLVPFGQAPKVGHVKLAAVLSRGHCLTRELHQPYRIGCVIVSHCLPRV